DRRGLAAAEAGEIGEQLDAPALRGGWWRGVATLPQGRARIGGECGSDWGGGGVREGGQAELRGLRDDGILRAGLRIGSEGEGGLRAARKGHQQIRGHVGFGQTEQ